MAHKDRKIMKKRGTRTCGYGNTQKHRGSGSRGGVGMAGSKKHKWSYISKYFPNYFGKKGFKRPKKVLKEIRTINLRDLEENFDKLLEKGKIVKEKDNSYFINLKDLGYGKLLGLGKVTKKFRIIIDSYSKKALEKIEAMGGKIESGISKANN